MTEATTHFSLFLCLLERRTNFERSREYNSYSDFCTEKYPDNKTNLESLDWPVSYKEGDRVALPSTAVDLLTLPSLCTVITMQGSSSHNDEEEVTIFRPSAHVANRPSMSADTVRDTISGGHHHQHVRQPLSNVEESREDSLNGSQTNTLESLRRVSLPREAQRGSILMPRPSSGHHNHVYGGMPSSPSKFGSYRNSIMFDSTHTEEMDTLPREKMKLVNVTTLERPERQRDYKGQLRRWPGLLLLAVLVCAAIVAITLGAQQSHTAAQDRRVNFMVKDQKRRAIQDGLVDSDTPLVDEDGQVNNPKTYSNTVRKCVLPDYQSKNGKVVAVAPNGTEVVVGIKGTNWFGMETGTAIPFGLWQNDVNGTTVYEIASFLHRNKFNSIRLPLCASSILKNTVPDKRLINLNTNRAVSIKSYMDLLKSILQALAYRDITVLISMHTLVTAGATGAWFNADVSEDDFLNSIDILTKELCNDDYWNVIGIDLKNEPNDCGWGPADKASAKCD
ncbi:hypothetical protein AeRB84_013801, partial [Aphanomyces euteiches]